MQQVQDLTPTKSCKDIMDNTEDGPAGLVL